MASTKTLPFRQDDPAWAGDLMWDRQRVIDAHVHGNAARPSEAERLLRDFGDDNNSIGREGCLLTCLAMTLRMLDIPVRRRGWTPRKLNRWAHDAMYYTPAGVAMATLYADLVSEVSSGEVQLCAKEEYLSGERGWPATYGSTSALVRGYRLMSPADRRHYVAILKIGTYDDTVASHYVIIDPKMTGGISEDDPVILDPAMPENARRPWRLSHSSRRICGDRAIKKAWQTVGIHPLQLAGVWIFARWRSPTENMLMRPLVDALANDHPS